MLNQNSRLSVRGGLKPTNPAAGFIETATEPDPAAFFAHGASLPSTQGCGQAAPQIDVAGIDEPTEAECRGHLLPTEAVLMGGHPVDLVLSDHTTAEGGEENFAEGHERGCNRFVTLWPVQPLSRERNPRNLLD